MKLLQSFVSRQRNQDCGLGPIHGRQNRGDHTGVHFLSELVQDVVCPFTQ